MINAYHVKLKIEIELYRTTKHENTSRVVFTYMQVSSKQERRPDQEAQSHREICGV